MPEKHRANRSNLELFRICFDVSPSRSSVRAASKSTKSSKIRKSKSVHDQLSGHLLSVYRFAMHLCGDQHVAEDLTQEAMLRGLRHVASLHDPNALRSWLFRIVQNLWTDQYRSKKHQTATSFPCPTALKSTTTMASSSTT